MNKTLENRDIEQDAVIEYLKPKKVIISDADKLLECPCAKNNIKPRTNYDKITEAAESLAEFIIFVVNESKNQRRLVSKILKDKNGKNELKKTIKEWLQKECEE
jgi:GTP cyclohydrolase FolE2